MSYGQENVNGIIPAVEAEEVKETMYTSNFRPQAKKEYTANKHCTKTMGLATVNTHEPTGFLKKQNRSQSDQQQAGQSKTSDGQFKYTDRLKAPLPDFKNIEYKGEKPWKSTEASKDFIKKNAKKVIQSSAKKGEPKFVDTVGGNSSPLKPSGLVPNYVNKKNYGQVPSYLIKRRTQINDAKAEYEVWAHEQQAQCQMKVMSPDERIKIIQGLKKNWEELHHQYQGLSVVTDTAPKKNRKERMEAEMKQLERDIEMIEKHDAIFIE